MKTSKVEFLVCAKNTDWTTLATMLLAEGYKLKLSCRGTMLRIIGLKD